MMTQKASLWQQACDSLFLLQRTNRIQVDHRPSPFCPNKLVTAVWHFEKSKILETELATEASKPPK